MMKQFVIKSLSFLLLLLFILLMIKRTVPYYWGSPLLDQKINDVLADADAYDVFFFGSSRTYRHINPVLFDSISHQKSYNMGCPAMFYLETHYALEHFVNNYPRDKKITIFLQEMQPEIIKKRNLSTIRSKYYLDWKRLKMSLAYFKEQKNTEQIWYHLLSFVENQFSVAELKEIAKFHFAPKPAIRPVIKKQRGFYPINQQISIESSSIHSKAYIGTNIAYKADTLYQKRKERGLGQQEIMIRKVSPDELNLSIKNQQVEFYRIIANMELEADDYFDLKGHYSTKGAIIFTRKLAEEWRKIND